MKLADKRLQWVYEQAEELQRTVAALDYLWSNRGKVGDQAYRRADDDFHDLSLSFLLIAMGRQIPKRLWSVRDYSVLYGLIDDDNNDMRDD